MRLVIADTRPVRCLILIGPIEILPRLFERVVLPAAVQTELANPLAPPGVQRWIADSPAWLEIAQTAVETLSTGIQKGEAAAIALAAAMHADLLLIDDRRGVRAARQRGLRVAWAARSCRRAEPDRFYPTLSQAGRDELPAA